MAVKKLKPQGIKILKMFHIFSHLVGSLEVLHFAFWSLLFTQNLEMNFICVQEYCR